MRKLSKTIRFEQGDERWEELRRLCTIPEPGKRSALYFLASQIIGMEPLIPMTMSAHYSMCLFAEHATGIPEIDNARVQLIQVPRGFGKSAIITKCRTIQRLVSRQDYSVGIANEKQDLANAFLAQVKMEFEQNELLQALWPEVIPHDYRNTVWSADRIVLNREKPRPTSPSVIAAGVGATVTGIHVDEWIVDDPISQNAAENALRGSFSEIEATNRWFHRLEPLLCSPKRDPITVIGTPWWIGDTYSYIEGNEEDFGLWGHGEKLKTYIWQLTLPTGETQDILLHRRGEMAIYRRPAISKGKSIFPERWTIDELEMMEQQDPIFYQANYMLAPAEGGDAAFRFDWLNHYEIEGNRKNIWFRNAEGKRTVQRLADLTTYISIDPAFSDRRTAAKTAIAVVGTDGQRLFLLEDFAERGLGPDELGVKVAEFAARYRPQMIMLETIVAQRVLLEPIRRALTKARIFPLPVIHEIPSHGSKSKELRIYGLQPWFRAGQFYIHKTMNNFKSEYGSFPRGSQRDFLDALSFQIEPAWERMAGAAAISSEDAMIEEQKQKDKLLASIGKYGGY